MPWAPPMCVHVRVQCLCAMLGVLTWGNRACCDGSNEKVLVTSKRGTFHAQITARARLRCVKLRQWCI
eukprot:623363-Prymnesium_polylepis.1